ncbi:MAG: ABC transporter permease [Pyrinomonadaceae bacterium]
MSSLWQDIRFAARMLLKSRGFTFVAVLSLAVGIGANTTIFSLVNVALLRPLPKVADSGRLAEVKRTLPNGDSFALLSYLDYAYLRDHNDVFEGLAAYSFAPFSLNAGGEPERAKGLIVSGNYFDVLGVKAARGRFFLPEEDRTPGANPVAVISHELWQRRFGGDSSAIGRQATLNGHSFTIIGVAPEGFKSPFVYLAPDVYVPLMMQAQAMPGRDVLDSRGTSWLGVRGRLKAGVKIEGAQVEISGLAKRLEREFPETNQGEGVRLHPVSQVPHEVRSAVVGFMSLLMCLVGLVLLIACANVAGIFLARAAARRKEMAIRLAVGASRARIIRQLLVESVLLFLCGGIAGAALAAWTNELLLAFRPSGVMPISLDLNLDWRVLGFTLLVSLVTGLVFGLAPALQASKPDVLPALKDEARTGVHRARMRGAFVVGQIAISLMLLIAAGLFVRSLRNAAAINPGFNPDGVQTAMIDLTIQGYTEERGRDFYRRLVEQVGALPGVESASLANAIPLSGRMFNLPVRVEGYEPPAGEDAFYIDANTVDENYLRTLQVPLLRGRDFSRADKEGAPRVAIINETMARKFFGGADAVGKTFSFNRNPSVNNSALNDPARSTIEVVGVVKDGKYETLGEGARPFIYLPFAQRYFGAMTLHIRTTGDPATVFAALRRETQNLDPNLPLTNVMPMTEAIGFSLIPLRMAATIVGVLGLFGLALAAVGIYGVIAYSVTQRTKEIGIRIALGAQTGDVLGIILRQGLMLTVIGVCLGVAGAFVLTRYLASLLYGVSAIDPLVFIGIALVLAAVALLASYVPARRAAKIDPMVALRYE